MLLITSRSGVPVSEPSAVVTGETGRHFIVEVAYVSLVETVKLEAVLLAEAV